MPSNLPTSLHRAQVVPVPPYPFPSEAPPPAQTAKGSCLLSPGASMGARRPRDGAALKPQALGRNERSRHALGPVPSSGQMEGWGHL